MKYLVMIMMLCSATLVFSQTTLRGTVTDMEGASVFAANIYLKKTPQKGTTSNWDGNFILHDHDMLDTLVISYIGYTIKKIPLTNIDANELLIVALSADNGALQEVIVSAKAPISEQFSMVEMSMLKDVYLNPLSQGDPLKAITILPSSTNTDETANPSLRGSSPDRSVVILNNVPIDNPVRASQINNQGFFSLFNPEIISKEYVYASNPPLTYGNTSAGLVEIESTKHLDKNQLQWSSSLANIGLLISQKIDEDHTFVQAYSNYQFSDAYVGMQPNKLPDIKAFNAQDVGINFHIKLNRHFYWNSLSYFIHEAARGNYQYLAHKGKFSSHNRRIFTVNNIRYFGRKGVLSINVGTNHHQLNFKIDNGSSDQKKRQLFTSINYWRPIFLNSEIQFGVTKQYYAHQFKGRVPNEYSSVPNVSSDTLMHNNILEAYIFTQWKVKDKFIFSSGMRSNVPTRQQKYYFSSQLNTKYQIHKNQFVLFSVGQYHHYALPNPYSKQYSLLSSQQLALDYQYKTKNTTLKAAVYVKNETGKQLVSNLYHADKVNTFGLEFYAEHYFHKHLTTSISNAFVNQKMTINNVHYKDNNDLRYFLKYTLQYNRPSILSLSISYIGRPGTRYQDILGSTFDDRTNTYRPVFSHDINTFQFNHYNRLDISVSKYMKLRSTSVLAFVTLANALDTANERSALYNRDYSAKHFNYHQKRTLYGGLVWHLNY